MFGLYLIRLKLWAKQFVGQCARNMANKCWDLSSEYKKFDLNKTNMIKIFFKSCLFSNCHQCKNND